MSTQRRYDISITNFNFAIKVLREAAIEFINEIEHEKDKETAAVFVENATKELNAVTSGMTNFTHLFKKKITQPKK